VVMVRVKNVAQDRNHDSRVLKLGKCRDRLPKPKPEVERPEPEVARLMTSADKNRGHFVQTNRLL